MGSKIEEKWNKNIQQGLEFLFSPSTAFIITFPWWIMTFYHNDGFKSIVFEIRQKILELNKKNTKLFTSFTHLNARQQESAVCMSPRLKKTSFNWKWLMIGSFSFVKPHAGSRKHAVWREIFFRRFWRWKMDLQPLVS